MGDKFATFKSDGSLGLRLIKGLHIIPTDAVEVDEDLWGQLLTAKDVTWHLGKDGAVTNEVVPEPTPDYKTLERDWRDAELSYADTALLMAEDNDPTAVGAPAAWREYRIALRGWPESPSFPDKEGRPVRPT